jgi:hypothetical protein
MLNSLFERFFSNLVDPVDRKDFESWIEQVAEKITEIAVELDDDELIDAILADKSFNMFEPYYDTLLLMFKSETDLEKAAYEILNIIVKNKKNNES